jgi:hypothetical protein
MSKHTAGMPARVEWRQLSPYLWAGAGELGQVGTIEHGRRYAAIDVEGKLRHRCRTLEEAQALLIFIAEQADRTTAPDRIAA